MRNVEVHRHDDEVCDCNVRDVEDAVVAAANKAQGSGADGCEEDERDDAEDDVPVLDTLGQESRHGKEDEVKDCVQNKEEIDDAAQDLMGRFELFV